MSRNPNHGIAGKTPSRPATHSPNLQPGDIQCPRCGARHILNTQSSNGQKLGRFWCAGCSLFFSQGTS